MNDWMNASNLFWPKHAQTAQTAMIKLYSLKCYVISDSESDFLSLSIENDWFENDLELVHLYICNQQHYSQV